MTTKTRSIHIGLLLILATCSACFPDAMTMDGDGSAPGDGDPGDGDSDMEGETSIDDLGTPDSDDGDDDGEFGSPCPVPPVVTCTTEVECWASKPGWTAEAAVVIAEMVATAVESRAWIPSDVEVGDECWTLAGTDRHVCTVGVCGQRLLGQPASEIPLEPDAECEFIGAWSSTGWAFDTCFGILDGVAVELRAA